jgi:hypothetical protein
VSSGKDQLNFILSSPSSISTLRYTQRGAHGMLGRPSGKAPTGGEGVGFRVKDLGFEV